MKARLAKDKQFTVVDGTCHNCGSILERVRTSWYYTDPDRYPRTTWVHPYNYYSETCPVEGPERRPE